MTPKPRKAPPKPKKKAINKPIDNTNKSADHFGRPLLYNSVEDIQVAINKYFDTIGPVFLRDKSGECVLDKFSKPIVIDYKHPNVTGLALALGFNSRQSFYNYQGREDFLDTMSRARAYIEDYTTNLLYGRDTSNGARFYLERIYQMHETKNLNVDGKLIVFAGDEDLED
jgi:hypothetical protein